MTTDGLKSSLLTSASALDEFIGLRTVNGVKKTVRVPQINIANLIAVSTPVQGVVNSVNARIDSAITTYNVNYALRSQLYADLLWAAGSTARVVGDGANNGIYKKAGASGSGSWTLIGPLPEATDGTLFSATQAQAREGTSTTKLMTPANVHDKFAFEFFSFARVSPTVDLWYDVTLDNLNRIVKGTKFDGTEWLAIAGVLTQIAVDPKIVDVDGLPAVTNLRVKGRFEFQSSIASLNTGLYPAIDDWRELDIDMNNLPIGGTKIDGTKWRAKNGVMLLEAEAAASIIDPGTPRYSYNGSTGRAVLATDYPADLMFICIGQSLATGDTNDPADATVTTTAEHPGFALMTNQGAYPALGSTISSYIDLREQTRGTSRETICSGAADAIMRRLGTDMGYKPRIVFLSAGRPGLAYWDAGGSNSTGLKRGSIAYNEALRIVERCRDISAASGRALIVAGFFILHGEADNPSTPRHLYARALNLWISELGDDLTKITGQQERIRAYASQPDRGGGNTAGLVPVVNMAQMDAEERDPLLKVVGPIYFSDPSSDNIHPVPRSYRRIGEMFGNAVLQDYFGPYYEPLRVMKDEAYFTSSSVFRMKFTMPIALEANDTRITISTLGNGKGVEFTDGSVSPPTITSVAVVNTDTLEVTLSGASTGPRPRAFIACRRSAANGTPGRVFGFRSGIRSTASYDTDPNDSYVLYHWACSQVVDLPKP